MNVLVAAFAALIILLVAGSWAISTPVLRKNWITRTVAVVVSAPIPVLSVGIGLCLWLFTRDGEDVKQDIKYLREWYTVTAPGFIRGDVARLTGGYW